MFPCTIQEILLFIYFICGSILLLIPYSQFIPPLSQLFSVVFKKKKLAFVLSAMIFCMCYFPGYGLLSPSLWELD